MRQDDQSHTGIEVMVKAADPLAPVRTVFEDTTFQSVSEPLLSVQKISDQAAGSFDDIVENTAVPQTKFKRSSRAAGYNYGEEDE